VIVLSALVLAQSALLLGVVALKTKLPPHGILLPAPVELYCTIVLAGLAGISLGLCVSAVASTPDKATSLIPIVLVPQVLFAGIMFALEGLPGALSYAVSSRAAVDAMSATVGTNALSSPMNLLRDEPRYAHTSSVLLVAWGLLVAQTLVFAAAAWWRVRTRR